MKRLTGLHVIVGGEDLARTLELARIAQESGAAVVQFRNKTAPRDVLLDTAIALRKLLRHTTFIVNDHVDIAQEVCADGVHLGQDDLPISKARARMGPNAIIGGSTSNVEQAVRAESDGADYVGFGHLFATRSKIKTTPPKTMEELRSIVQSVSIPVIAIGGITEYNMKDVLVEGLGGIALIRAIAESQTPRETIRNFVERLKDHDAIYA